MCPGMHSLPPCLIYVLLQSFTTLVLCDATLDDQNNQNEINPLHDDENNDLGERDHDKRTIFNSELENYGWAKHIGVHPSGFRYILGVGPVDLKYIPVIRNPFKNHRPKWPSKVFKPFRPVRPIHEHVWKPTRPIGFRPLGPIARPVLPLLRPGPPFGKPGILRPVIAQAPQWPNKSWQQDEWKQKPIAPKPVVALTPVNVVKPIPPPQAVPVVPLQPINPIIPIQPSTPSVPLNPVVPLQPNPIVQLQPVPQPVVPIPTTISTDPWVPLVKPAYPLVPQQPLIEVAKPNLPVLPLGATFPSPVLQQASAGPSLVFHRPQVIHQNPAAVVEFHGNHHPFISPNGYINFPKLASIQPQYAPQFPQNTPTHLFSTGVQIQQNPQVLQTPFDAGQPIAQYPQFQPSVPQVTQVQQLPRPQQQYAPQVTDVQQLPVHEQQYVPQGTQFQQYSGQEQQVPQVQQFAGQGQQAVDNQYLPPSAHGQLPIEGDPSQQQQNTFGSNPQSSFFFQSQDQQYVPENDIQQQLFQSSNNIQPGQTDVQTPLYLPPHNTYNPQLETFMNAFSHQFISNQDNALRPSAALEPPYDFGYNRRVDSGEVEEENITIRST